MNHAVGEDPGLLDVVGDVKSRNVSMFQVVTCHLGQPQTTLDVDGSKRFVEKNEFRSLKESPPEGDALSLTPGKFGNASFFKARHAKDVEDLSGK